MQLIEKRGTKYNGVFKLYESVDEAISHGVKQEELLTREGWLKFGKEYKGKRPVVLQLNPVKHILFSDGKVGEVYAVQISERSVIIRTACGVYSLSNTKIYSNKPWRKNGMNPNAITKSRYRFVMDWLFGDMAIEDSARKNLDFDRYWLKKFNLTSEMSALRFAYYMITLPWFDRLLNENRLVRDRYMSLVHAFKAEGITEAYLAQYIKAKLDSDNPKERMNALNKALDIMMAAEKAQPAAKELPSHLVQLIDEVPTELPKLPEQTTGVQDGEIPAYSEEEVSWASYIQAEEIPGNDIPNS